MKKYLVLFILFVSCSAFANHDKGSFVIGLGGNMGYLYSIKDINDKITTEGAGIIDFIPTASALKWNYNFDFSVGYSFNKHMRVSIYANYLMFSKSIIESLNAPDNVYTGTTSVTASYYEFQTGFRAIGVGPLFTYYIADAGNFSFSATTGFLYYPSVKFFQDTTYGNSSTDTALTTNLNSIEASGSTWGALIKLSADYYFNRHFALGLDLGYNYIKAPSLTDAAGNPIDFTYLDGTSSTTAAPLAINASNIFAGLSMKFEFGGSSGSSRSEAYSTQVESSPSSENVIMSNSPSGLLEETTEQTTEMAGEDDFQEEPTIKDLKYKVQELYQEAKDNRLRKRKRALGKIHKYIKRKQKKWRRMSAKSHSYYINKIGRKIERAEQINR